MNILLIIEGTYPWYRGGVSEWTYQYLKALKEHTFSIVQIATDEFQDKDPEYALYPLTDNIERFVRISPPEMSEEWESDSSRWFLSFSDKLKDASDKHDLIHVTNTGFAGWLGAQLSKLTKTPLVLTEHAIYWKEIDKGAVALECGYKIPEQSDQKNKVIKSFKAMARSVYSQSSKIITVSQSNILHQEKLGAKRIEYIPNGIPSSYLNPVHKTSEQPVIGWVGRCAEMKNPLRFFEFISEMRNSSLKAHFQMCLSDANEKDLEERVKETAERYPEVELIWNEDAKEYFKDFHFLVITSHNESQPLVMLEALANKALPAGWEVGDLTEQYGLVISKNADTSELVKAMEKTWTTPGHYQQMVKERYRFVKKHHVWSDIFNQYSSFFDEFNKEKVMD